MEEQKLQTSNNEMGVSSAGEEDEELNFDFSQCDITRSETVRLSQKRAVWVLENVDSQCDLENLISEARCLVEIEDGTGKKILLRFYFDKSEEVATNNYRFRYLSLCVVILDGNEESIKKGLNLRVKVDCLTEALWMYYNQMPETAVVIKSEKDRQGTVVEKYFLKYAVRSPMPSSTDSRGHGGWKWGYLLEQAETLKFGITITTMHSSSWPEAAGDVSQIPSTASRMSSEPTVYTQCNRDLRYNQQLTKPKGVSTDAVAKNFLVLTAESMSMMMKWNDGEGKAVGNDQPGEDVIIPYPFLCAVRHWLKTRKISDKTINNLRAVAGRELEFLKVLEKEAIRLCDSDYMFHSDFGKETVVKRISELIKESGTVLTVPLPSLAK